MAYDILSPIYTMEYTDGSTVDKAYVEQFRDNVVQLAQQDMSRLRSCVRNESVRGDKFNFERLGVSEAIQKTARHSITPIMDAPHSRRTLSMTDWQWADLVDEEDKLRMIISPESEYAKSGAMAMGRQFDRLIIAAMSGNSVDGDGSTVALPIEQKIAVGGAMSIAAMTEAKRIMDENEVASNDRYFAMKAADIEALLNTTEVTSADYNTVRALVKGEIDTYLGFKIIRTELLTTTVAANTCLAWQKDHVGLGVGRDVVSRIDQRKDLSYAWQVYLAFTAGAIRIQEEGVVEVTTDYA